MLQTAGRAARHVKGRVILYADHQTDAIREFLAVTAAHRERQIAYNREHGIEPKQVKRKVNEAAYIFRAGRAVAPSPSSTAADPKEIVAEMTREMLEAADRLEFERAAYLRDQIAKLRGGPEGIKSRKRKGKK